MGKFDGLINSSKRTIIKHSAGILVGFGITGFISATIFSISATPKALKLIDEAKKNKKEDLTKFEIVKATWTCYIPTVIIIGVSTACIIGASKVNNRRNAALATAYALSEATLAEYKNKVVEAIGVKKEQEIRDSIDKDAINRNPVNANEIILTGKGTSLCYDPQNDRYFHGDIDTIKRAINEMNFQMMNGLNRSVSLNEFYSSINLKETTTGYDLGWNIDNGLIELTPGAQLTESGEPCIIIKFNIPPKYGYDK